MIMNLKFTKETIKIFLLQKSILHCYLKFNVLFIDFFLLRDYTFKEKNCGEKTVQLQMVLW